VEDKGQYEVKIWCDGEDNDNCGRDDDDCDEDEGGGGGGDVDINRAWVILDKI